MMPCCISEKEESHGCEMHQRKNEQNFEWVSCIC